MGHLSNRKANAVCCVAAVMLGFVLVTLGDPPEDGRSLAKGLLWGQATNQLWAGVGWETRRVEQGSFQDVRILIQSTITNVILSYLLPPDHKLAKAELRDANGVLLAPLKGIDLDGDLPRQIPSKDLPHFPARAHHLASLRNRLQLSPNIPKASWNFSMQDVYRIEQEGDYTFTVVVGLYHLEDEGESAVRMDLPPVTAKMHLSRSPAEGSEPSKGGEVWGGVANQFCAGLSWETMDRGQGAFQDLRIGVKTSKTNDLWGYYVPSGHRLAKVELRDAAGMLLAPLNGKKLDGDLSGQPMLTVLASGSIITYAAPEEPLVLIPNLAVYPWELSIQDIYRIEKEGDYTLAVTVALYHFTPDEQSVVRMDLSPVIVHMHLTPSQK
jgi:hypothetical protein